MTLDEEKNDSRGYHEPDDRPAMKEDNTTPVSPQGKREPDSAQCRTCHGTGRQLYGSTATWRGGIGGAAMTEDVCSRCWGTGDEVLKGPNLRKGERRTAHVERIKELEAALKFQLNIVLESGIDLTWDENNATKHALNLLKP